MKVTTKARYGINAIFELVLRQGSGPVPIKVIAEKQASPSSLATTGPTTVLPLPVPPSEATTATQDPGLMEVDKTALPVGENPVRPEPNNLSKPYDVPTNSEKGDVADPKKTYKEIITGVKEGNPERMAGVGNSVWKDRPDLYDTDDDEDPKEDSPACPMKFTADEKNGDAVLLSTCLIGALSTFKLKHSLERKWSLKGCAFSSGHM